MKKRKIFAIGIIALLLCSMTGLSACVKVEEQMGEFYSLQTAYNEGWLTTEDLQIIASYVYPGKKPQLEPLNEHIVADITKAEAKKLRTLYPDEDPLPSSDDVRLEYYGTYNDCIVVRMRVKFLSYLTVMEEMDIAGIVFEYSGPKPIVWKYY